MVAYDAKKQSQQQLYHTATTWKYKILLARLHSPAKTCCFKTRGDVADIGHDVHTSKHQQAGLEHVLAAQQPIPAGNM